MNIYQTKGFESRKDYLEQVSLTYGLDYDMVVQLAVFLGEDEDFDGLLAMCADEANCRVMEVG